MKSVLALAPGGRNHKPPNLASLSDPDQFPNGAGDVDGGDLNSPEGGE